MLKESLNMLLDDIQPFSNLTTNEIIQEKLLKLIASGKLHPGDKLPPQRLLAERMRVSQVPLREALRSLEALGIVEARGGSGWYVQNYSFDCVAKALAPRLPLDGRSLYDLDEIRTHLECAFLAEAMQNTTAESLDAAERALDEMDRLKAHPDRLPALNEQDRHFHLAVFAGVSNHLFIELMKMFWKLRAYLDAWVYGVPPLEPVSPEKKRENMIVVAEKHREFFNAVRDGDFELASDLRRGRLGP